MPDENPVPLALERRWIARLNSETEVVVIVSPEEFSVQIDDDQKHFLANEDARAFAEALVNAVQDNEDGIAQDTVDV